MSDYEEEGFGLSIGDVMSALLLIIILVMLAIVMQLKEETDLSSRFMQRQKELSDALKAEFGPDTLQLHMEIEEDGEVQFIPPDGQVLFAKTENKPDDRFKEILREFFPRYLKTLKGYSHQNEIREIRLEGHTDPSTRGNDPYLDNIATSQLRSYEVLRFILNDSQTETVIDSAGLKSELPWFKEKTVPMGFGPTKLIYKRSDSTKIDSDRSRRVCFRPLIDFEPYMKLAPKE